VIGRYGGVVEKFIGDAVMAVWGTPVAAEGFADAGEHALKGKAESARLWRATRVLAGVGGSQRLYGLEAPLTGRDAELRTVR
jgi:class 3 adenylate cyclase